MRQPLQLIQAQDGFRVNAYVVELVQKHINDYENLWREQLKLFLQEDKYWDWLFKFGFISKQENLEGYAIECEDITQGLMMIETEMHGSRDTIGKRLIYVEAIASAPWNRIEIKRPPLFKGVGTALLKFARLRSVELGYEGRVGLHSLPSAEKFYEKLGMLNYGLEEDYDDMVYFEYRPLRQKQTES